MYRCCRWLWRWRRGTMFWPNKRPEWLESKTWRGGHTIYTSFSASWNRNYCCVCPHYDVCVLLVAYFHKFNCSCWMNARISKKQKYIPVHTVCRKLSFGLMVAQAFLPLHALTGCDTVLFLAGHSRKTAWPVFLDHYVGWSWQQRTHWWQASIGTKVCKMYCSAEWHW